MARAPVNPTTPEELLQFLSTLDPGVTSLDLRRPGAAKRVQKFGRSANGDSPEQLAEKILRSAALDGQSRDVPIVYYELEAWGANSDQEGDATFSLRVKGAGNGGGIDLDQPDIGQAFVHLLRTNNDLVRLIVTSKDQAQEQLLRLLEFQGRQIQGHDERRVTLYRLLEDMSEVKLRREIEGQNAKLLEKRQDLVAQKLSAYLPVAMNRLLGGGPGSGKTPMAEQLLDTMLGSFAPEQIEALTNGQPISLSEEQQLIFAELYTSTAMKSQAREPKAIGGEPLKDQNGTGQKGSAS
jgi:hypothetical protein